MGINDGLSINRALHLYNEVVTQDLQEKRLEQLENKMASPQRESLFPQDKITLSSQNPPDGTTKMTNKVTSQYYLGSVQSRRIIDIYA